MNRVQDVNYVLKNNLNLKEYDGWRRGGGEADEDEK